MVTLPLLSGEPPLELLPALIDADPRSTPSPVAQEWREANLAHLARGYERVAEALDRGLPTFWGTLRLKVTRAPDGEHDLGVASLGMVTIGGAAGIAQVFRGRRCYRYHAVGTGTDPETARDTALQAELPNTRVAGTTAEGLSANIFRTVATATVGADFEVTEHGVFSGRGTLLARSVFAGILLCRGGGLISSYDLTFAAGR